MGKCNITHSNLWLTHLEQLHQRSLIDRQINLTQSERDQLKVCCKQIFTDISMDQLYQLCLSDHLNTSIDLSTNHKQVCLPMMNNLLWQRQCYHDYCQHWLRNVASINRQNFDDQYEILLEKRRKKFEEQFLNDFDLIDVNHQEISRDFQDLLCRINVTWSFRLVDIRLYPQYLTNLGVNQSRTVLVLQAKVSGQLLP